MILGLRILNGVLAALILIAVISVAADGKDALEVIASGIGASLWLLVPYVTWKAGMPNASMPIRRAAFILNGLLASLLALAGLAMSIGEGSLVHFIVFLIAVVPFVFNIWAVRRLATPAPMQLELVADPQVRTAEEPESIASEPPPARSVPAEPLAPAPGYSGPVIYQPSSNYFRRHWDGDLSLPVSYWVNGSLAGVLLYLVYTAVGAMFGSASIRTTAAVSIAVTLSFIVASIWSSVGIWRAAVNHPVRGGSTGWASAAKVMVVLGIVSFVTTLTNNLLPQLKENAQIAFGYDPLGRPSIKVSANGSALILSGMLGTGSAEEVRKMLDAAPGVRTLMLDSSGGRLKEAEDIARFVRERELGTYVETHCESACTYVFLAGVDRASTPNAKLGFHSPTFPGVDAVQQGKMKADMMRVYGEAGLPQIFISRIERTDAEEMWYPTRDELIDSGVVNRVSLGGEQAADVFGSKGEYALALRNVPMVLVLERRFPGTIDQAVDAAWRAREQGSIDRDITAAAREILSAGYPKLFAVANDQQLERFLNLSVDQLTAAKAIGDEACGLLIASKLDVTKVFPAELVEREMQWMLEVLEGEFEPRPALDQARVEKVLIQAFEGVPAEYLQVVGDLSAFSNDPELQCDASIAFYKAVVALPAAPRALALQGLFQADAE